MVEPLVLTDRTRKVCIPPTLPYILNGLISVLVREKAMEEGRRLPRSIYRRIASALDAVGNRHPLFRKWHMSFIVTIIFIVLLVAVILTGYFYYQGDKQAERMESGMDCKFSILGLESTLSRSSVALDSSPVFFKNDSQQVVELFTSLSLNAFDTSDGVSH
jgi:hypothetical protein